MADTELLPCPFCGVELAHERDDGMDFYDHPSADCIMSGTEIEGDRLHAWNRRATPPSPSTAPEGTVTIYGTPMDESAAFEAAARAAEGYGPGRPIAADRPSDLIRGRWEGEQAASANIARLLRERAALASRPAEVDDEGLPPLPLEAAHAAKGQAAFFVKWSEIGKPLRGELLLFTAEQYRQGQRDTVAADRARRDKGGA